MIVAMFIEINSVIGGFTQMNLIWLVALTIPLQVSDYSQLSDDTVWLQLHRIISEKCCC